MTDAINQLVVVCRQNPEPPLGKAVLHEEGFNAGKNGFAGAHGAEQNEANLPVLQGQISPLHLQGRQGNSALMQTHPDTPLTRAIRAYLQRTGETARSLSLKVGRNETLVRKILAGTVPRGDNLSALARELGLPAEALVPTGGPLPPPSLPEPNVVLAPDVPPPWPRTVGPVDVPIYGVAEGGQDGAFVINMADGPIDYATRPMKLLRAHNVFAVRIQGDSMAPAWGNGDFAYCHPGRGYGANDFVIVQLEAGPGEPPRAIFKQVVKADNDTLTLRQLNPDCTMTVDRSQVREVWPVLHWREIVP